MNARSTRLLSKALTEQSFLLFHWHLFSFTKSNKEKTTSLWEKCLHNYLVVILLFSKILFIYLWDTHKHTHTHTHTEAETHAEEEQAPCREPHVGLNPGTTGSCPGPRAGTKPLSHPGIPLVVILNEGNTLPICNYKSPQIISKVIHSQNLSEGLRLQEKVSIQDQIITQSLGNFKHIEKY